MEHLAKRKARLVDLRDRLLDGLVERDEPVRLALLAALAGEHILLLGPPGTAKSEIARRLRRAFRDATWFERLLTRFTVPEELFGPLSISALKEDRYHRQVEKYLPSASVAFLDEIFKANSAILNALLTLLNEREFDNGTERSKTPLISVVGASNELPSDEGMEALFDRFLLRIHVGPVSESGFKPLLASRMPEVVVPPELQLTPDDLKSIQDEARMVTLGDDVIELLSALRKHLAEQQVDVSDRRWRKIVGLLRVSALTDGRTDVNIWDCWLLQHCTWNEPKQRDIAKTWYEARVGAAQSADPAEFVKLTESFEKRLESDRNRKEVEVDGDGRTVYVDSDGKKTLSPTGRWPKANANGEPMYIAPNHLGHRAGPGEMTKSEIWSHLSNWGRQNLTDTYVADPTNCATTQAENDESVVPMAFSRLEIEQKVQRVRQHRESLSFQVRQLDERLKSLSALIDSHPWIAPGFSSVARPALESSLATHKSLIDRWQVLQVGFGALPVREE